MHNLFPIRPQPRGAGSLRIFIDEETEIYKACHVAKVTVRAGICTQDCLTTSFLAKFDTPN